MQRTKVYIDGFNLYHGVRQKHGRRYLWLDLEALARSILLPHQQLVEVQYFTARVRGQPASAQRQSTYLDALQAHSTFVRVVEGRFQEKQRSCRECGNSWRVFEEKETDVSVAVSLVEDAARGRFDSALIVSGDSDLCPAVRAAKRLAPASKIVAVFPPRRHSVDLQRAVDGHIHLGTDKLRRSLLPDPVMASGGARFHRPAYWQ